MPEGISGEEKQRAETAMNYIICSSPRSGSTLVAQALRDMGIGHPGEYLNPSLKDEHEPGGVSGR